MAIYLFWTTTFIISIMTTHTCIILDMSWTWPHITVVISTSEQHHCIVTILVPVAPTVHLNSPKLPPLLIFHLIQWSCYKLVQKRSECLIKILHYHQELVEIFVMDMDQCGSVCTTLFEKSWNFRSMWVAICTESQPDCSSPYFCTAIKVIRVSESTLRIRNDQRKTEI